MSGNAEEAIRVMTDLQSLLSALVRYARIPQVQIAEKAGMSQKHLSQMLNGRIEGTLTMWQAVLDAAGVSLPNNMASNGDPKP